MTHDRRRPGLVPALLLAALVGLAPGCTLFNDYLPGSPLTLDPPVAQVTVDGEIHVDQASAGSGCSSGDAVFWGNASNTGDVDLEDVSIVIDAFNSAGALLGSFTGGVYNGTVTDTTSGTTTTSSASTSLTVKQSGTFSICAPLSASSVARTEYRTDFVYVVVTGTQ